MNMKKITVLSVATLLFLILIVFLHSFVPSVENGIYNLSFSVNSAKSSDSVVIVGIDSKSIGELGSWPWSRSTMATLVEKINNNSPKAIALDFRFPHNSDIQKISDDDSLATVFSHVNNLVLPFHAGGVSLRKSSENTSISPLAMNHRFLIIKDQNKISDYSFYTAQRLDIGDKKFFVNSDYSGFLNVSTRKTNQKIFEVIHVIKANDEYFPSFAVGAVAAFKNLNPKDIILDATPQIILKDSKIPLSSYAGSTLLNFRGPAGTISTVSATDVIFDKIKKEFFENKLVFIGITDASIFSSEFFATPVSRQFPGVEIWATSASDIIDGLSITKPSLLPSILFWITVFLIFPGLALFIPSNKKLLFVSSGLVLLAINLGIWIILFKNQGIWWNVGFHIYAWIFSILWLIVQKTNPTLIEVKSLELEPDASDDHDITPPPDETSLLSEIPDNDTCKYVVSTIKMTVTEKTAVESEDLTITSDFEKLNLVKKMRKIAGGDIIKVLGSGGMADVYLVWNPRLEVYRAIKVIKSGQSEQLLDRFETEIKIFANLNHPNIVQCYNAGEWHGLPYLEMEYIPGAAMDDVLKKCTILTPLETLAVGILVCRALHYAHLQTVSVHEKSYKGIIHRDLKPANIMLSRGGRIKLTDFGIARPQDVGLHTNDNSNIVGTLPYLAPEQLDGETITIRTDIYAMGATLYELLTGEKAFPQQNVSALVKAKANGQIKPMNKSTLIPPALASIIEKAISISPAKRYDSAKAMERDLEKVLISLSNGETKNILRNLVSRYNR